MSPTKSIVAILSFFLGIVFFYFKSIHALVGLFVFCFFRPSWRWVWLFLIGLLWGFLHLIWVETTGMPHVLVLSHAHVEGVVVSLPIQSPQKTQFDFQVQRCNGHAVRAKMVLSCYNHCPKVRAGEYWVLDGKIKKPHNLANPGGFDYEAWMSARHALWAGTIRPNTMHHVAKRDERYSVLVCRQYLADNLKFYFKDLKILGIVQALALGVATHIDKTSWDLFRRTGTTHLMVISGSHIALVAGIIYAVFRRLWSYYPRGCLYCPAQKIAAIAGMLAALVYALLAGFEVPSQRALIVCFIVFARFFVHQQHTVWQSWRYALLMVVLFEPHSVLMPGFYLSFIAVAILLFIQERFSFKGIKNMLVTQFACTLGLMPLTLFWFSYGSINGLVSNVIAIPWIGFVLVPLSLLSVLLALWSLPQTMVLMLTKGIDGLFVFLSWMDGFYPWNLTWIWSYAYIPLALMLVMLFVVFVPMKEIYPAVLLLLIASLTPKTLKVKQGDAQVDVLDVGQGLAVAVHTAHHTLIYDTGLKQYQGSDMAEMVIIPYLKAIHRMRVDKVIISHPDMDHRGGLNSLLQTHWVRELVVDDPHFYHQGVSCHHDVSDWTWDGVTFRFFSLPDHVFSKNNHSCVLQIKTRHASMLLPGDIEKPAEDYLLQHDATMLSSDVLLVPHHASKTSSSYDFVQTIHPIYALASFGFDNRYHFPHPKTLETYQDMHIPFYNTADFGMITVILPADKKPDLPRLYRQRKFFL